MPNHTKVCFIIPEYNENTSDHFYHHYELLKELSEKLDIFLIAEKSNIRKINLGRKFYVQKFKFLPLRFLESFLIILRARILGYKTFYTHYCYIGAINAGLVSRVFGGVSYYWNCAMNWLFKQSTLSGLGYKLSLKISHYLVTGSEEMKKGYSDNYKLSFDKIKVIPNWINLSRFKPTKAQIKKSKLQTILFVHWLSKRKGADMIVPIVLHLKAHINNFKLLVVGEGPYKEKLLQEVEKNKLSKKIELLGPVPNRDLNEYYAKADLFIMPSMEEGFPRVLLETMAMGIPFVATDIGAVKELSSEIAQRFLVKPGDVEKFAHKIEILLTDEKIYSKFKKEGLEKVKEYSLENVIEKFINLFK